MFIKVYIYYIKFIKFFKKRFYKKKKKLKIKA